MDRKMSGNDTILRFLYITASWYLNPSNLILPDVLEAEARQRTIHRTDFQCDHFQLSVAIYIHLRTSQIKVLENLYNSKPSQLFSFYIYIYILYIMYCIGMRCSTYLRNIMWYKSRTKRFEK